MGAICLTLHPASAVKHTRCQGGNFFAPLPREQPTVNDLIWLLHSAEKHGRFAEIRYEVVARAMSCRCSIVGGSHVSVNPFPLKQRSAATNGRRRFVDKIDHRSAWMRRWKDLCAAHQNDLGGEGLSEAQVSICRRISTIEIALESFEAKMAEGKIVDPDVYGRLCGRLARLVELVGVTPLAKPFDALSELTKTFQGQARAIDDDGDDNEAAPIEAGLDREPGEA